MKINILTNTKNEYDFEWFKDNFDKGNINVKDILMYSRNYWVNYGEYEIIYEDDIYCFISDNTDTFLIKKELNKGDKIKVVDTEYTYLWFDKWFEENNIDATHWCYGTYPKEDEIYTIVKIGRHLIVSDWVVCLIKDDKDRMFLIRDKGIKRV